MTSLSDPVMWSLLGGLTGAAAVLASRYVRLPGERDAYLASTKQVSDASFAEAGQLGALLSHEFQALKEREVRARQKRGEQVQPLRLIENEIKRKSGFPIDVRIFNRRKDEDVKLSCGLLLTNSVSARDYKSGRPYEVAAQAMYEGMREINRLETCMAAFDTDLHVIKTFDGSYDATPGGILMKTKGHHAYLSEALRLMGEQFEDARHRRILYVLTGPVRSSTMRDKVERQLEALKAQRIQVALLYINPSRRDIDEPLSRYVGVVDPEDLGAFPQQVRRVHDKIMETSM